MKKALSLSTSVLLISGSSLVSATTLRQPPPFMTMGLLQAICKDRGTSSYGYCDGYLTAVIEAYLGRVKSKKNFCLQFLLIDYSKGEIRKEILALPEQSMDGSPRAEPWIRDRLSAKCEPKR